MSNNGHLRGPLNVEDGPRWSPGADPDTILTVRISSLRVGVGQTVVRAGHVGLPVFHHCRHDARWGSP